MLVWFALVQIRRFSSSIALCFGETYQNPLSETKQNAISRRSKLTKGGSGSYFNQCKGCKQYGLIRLVINYLLFNFQDEKHVRMIAVGVGNYGKFMHQLHEVAGDNVYTAENFDELSNLFDKILVETCSKYILSEIALKSHVSLRFEQIHYVITQQCETSLWALTTRATRGLGTRAAKRSVKYCDWLIFVSK